jgi:hypothetical protein
MTEEQRIHRGNRAREVLENEEFAAAFDAIDEELTQAWKNSPQRDADGREKLFLALTMLHKIKAALSQTVDSGKLALVNLQHSNPTMQQEARRFLGIDS